MALPDRLTIPQLSQEEARERRWQSLYVNRVGPDKPLASRLFTDFSLYGFTLDEVLRSLAAKEGVAAFIYTREGDVPELVAYHEKALQSLLDANKPILESAGWPTRAKDFALRTCRWDTDPKNKELLAVIAAAFANHDFFLSEEERDASLEERLRLGVLTIAAGVGSPVSELTEKEKNALASRMTMRDMIHAFALNKLFTKHRSGEEYLFHLSPPTDQTDNTMYRNIFPYLCQTIDYDPARAKELLQQANEQIQQMPVWKPIPLNTITQLEQHHSLGKSSSSTIPL